MISAKPPALTRGRTPESLALRPAWLGPRPGPHPSPECMGTGLWRRTGLQSLEGDLGFRPDWLCAPGRLVPALRLCFPFLAKHGQCSHLPTSQAVTGAGEMPTCPLAARGTRVMDGSVQPTEQERCHPRPPSTARGPGSTLTPHGFVPLHFHGNPLGWILSSPPCADWKL